MMKRLGAEYFIWNRFGLFYFKRIEIDGVELKAQFICLNICVKIECFMTINPEL